MKKILSLSLVLMLAFSFMACNKQGTDDGTVSVATTPAVTPTESISDETPVPDGTTPAPTEVPTQAPDGATPAPTEVPTQAPNGTTPVPTAKPTAQPTAQPTAVPTAKPTATPAPTPKPTPNYNVGGMITFGTYEQDNNIANGKEEIEWLVLDKQDGKILIISKYVIDAQKYNSELTWITWETCTLRTWLNNDFLNTAFSSEEKGTITFGGTTTQDKVFLLSENEAKEYFETNEMRCASPTEYAISQGALRTVSLGTTRWTLRESASMRTTAQVSIDGEVSPSRYGYSVDTTLGIRPAMWIDISNL